MVLKSQVFQRNPYNIPIFFHSDLFNPVSIIMFHRIGQTLLVHVHAMHKLGSYSSTLLVVRISAFSDFEAIHVKQGHRYRVVPYW